MNPYDLAYEYAMHTNECIYLTGKAGTGKTTFLRRLQRECPKQIVVCAPTGVAAINAEGVTIHSLFQLPPQLFLPTEQARKQLFSEMQMRDQKRRLLRNMEMLIIDEVSMVRSDLLDTMDTVLRHVRHRPQLPFGGVQVLFIGDLYQLSPVAREEEWYMMRTYYRGPYFFQARVFDQIRPIYIELDHVYRQSNQAFVDLLNQVRSNSLSHEGLEKLNARYEPGKTAQDYLNEAGKSPILLSTHNRKADIVNEEELARLKHPEFRFHAEIEKNFPESMYPMDTELVLKKGARVMFIKNDSSLEKAYYNGKLGTVVDINAERIMVHCAGDKTAIEVHQEVWENLRYEVDKEHTDEVHSVVAGTFKHYPLRLAWAVTIHKAQGLTFDHVIIDAEDAFAAGQVYVALSRCRSLEGIRLLSKIPAGAMTNAHDVLQFTEQQPTKEQIEALLEPSEVSYFAIMLCSLYDFRNTYHQLERLKKIVHDAASFNQPETDTYIRSLLDEVSDWQKIGETFQNQLRHILTQPEPDYGFLGTRLKDAGTYFGKRLKPVLKLLTLSPACSEDKDDAKLYHTQLEEILIDLSRQAFIIDHIAYKPSIRRYFELRKRFVAPKIKAKKKKINVFLGHSKKK